MRTKLALLATTTLAAMAIATPAEAADGGRWYISLSGGANWLDNNNFTDVTTGGTFAMSFDSESDTGYIIAGAVGYSLGGMVPGLRVEAEVGYRQNQADGIWLSDTDFTNTTAGTSSGPLDYDHTTLSVMANVWYEFDLAGVKPYFGGGLGWADIEVDGTYIGGTVPAFSYSDNGFAWQAGGGINFQVAPNVQLGVGYRYMSGPEVTILSPDPTVNLTSGEIDSDNHSGVVTLTFGL